LEQAASIVSSAHTDADTLLAAGADDYVSKPIVGPELGNPPTVLLLDNDALMEYSTPRNSRADGSPLIEHQSQPLC